VWNSGKGLVEADGAVELWNCDEWLAGVHRDWRVCEAEMKGYSGWMGCMWSSDEESD